MSKLEDDLLMEFIEQGKEVLVLREAIHKQREAMVAILLLMKEMRKEHPDKVNLNAAFVRATDLTREAHQFCETNKLY